MKVMAALTAARSLNNVQFAAGVQTNATLSQHGGLQQSWKTWKSSVQSSGPRECLELRTGEQSDTARQDWEETDMTGY